MKTVLITGGSSGIGFEMSSYFATAGYRILWVSLFEDELAKAKEALMQANASLELHYLQKDLSQIQSAKEVFAWVQSNQWRVDVLVNNAGIGTYGFLQETDFEKEMRMIHLNVLNVYQLSRLFFDEMIARAEGTIINISSTSALQPVPKMTTYAATKAFVKHFSESLTEELRIQKSPVRILTVFPAAIKDTPFQQAAKMDKVKTFSGIAVTTAKEVAKDVWNAYQSGKNTIVSGKRMRLLNAFRNWMPTALQRYIVNMEIEEDRS